MLEDIIRKEYLKNKQAQQVFKEPTEGFKKTINRLILFQKLVYVLEHQQNDTIQMYHDDSLREHQEVHKMIEAISRSYYFSHMQRKVRDYVSRCDLCHKVKSTRHKSYREMKTALISNWPWASIVINFIVKLLPLEKPLIRAVYDLILTVVNQLIKKVQFLSYKEASNAKELTYTFLWHITVMQDLSDKIISDRDKLFMSNFWTALIRHLELLHKLSTVYHSQMNEQTEQMNQVVEQYLWEYIDYH